MLPPQSMLRGIPILDVPPTFTEWITFFWSIDAKYPKSARTAMSCECESPSKGLQLLCALPWLTTNGNIVATLQNILPSFSPARVTGLYCEDIIVPLTSISPRFAYAPPTITLNEPPSTLLLYPTSSVNTFEVGSRQQSHKSRSMTYHPQSRYQHPQ